METFCDCDCEYDSDVEIDNGDVCPICLDPLPVCFKDSIIMSCGHRYCRTCFTNHVHHFYNTFRQPAKCALCRSSDIFWDMDTITDVVKAWLRSTISLNAHLNALIEGAIHRTFPFLQDRTLEFDVMQWELVSYRTAEQKHAAMEFVSWVVETLAGDLTAAMLQHAYEDMNFSRTLLKATWDDDSINTAVDFVSNNWQRTLEGLLTTPEFMSAAIRAKNTLSCAKNAKNTKKTKWHNVWSGYLF